MIDAIDGGVLTKHPGESVVFGCNFDKILNKGDTVLPGSPTVNATPAGLTIVGASVVDVDTVLLGQTIPANRGVKVRISGGDNNVEYIVAFTIDSASGDVRIINGTLVVK